MKILKTILLFLSLSLSSSLFPARPHVASNAEETTMTSASQQVTKARLTHKFSSVHIRLKKK